ncbi:hypothetical protein NFI96_000625 [Prochilodus magdalenae]|nr:hypothetical protein NFI96_000625 [Prochilodus magdalenae]
MFFDFSSAFGTLQPVLLGEKLQQMQSVVAGAILYAVVFWGNSLNKHAKAKLDNLIQKGVSGVGGKLDTLEMAEFKDWQVAVNNQGRLLGQHNPMFESLTSSVSTLTSQQSEQHSQLVQISTNLRDISTQLAQLSLSPALPEAAGAAAVSPVCSAFPVSKPDKYDGSPELCRGFLLQCSIYFSSSPPSSEKARMSFVISCLTGKALDWATAVWPSVEHGTYDQFLNEFKAAFDHPLDGRSQGELLLKLRQGARSVADYALEFRILAAGSGWNEPPLIVVFRNGLRPEIQIELACRDDKLSLDDLISLAIRLDHCKEGSSATPRTPLSSNLVSDHRSPAIQTRPRLSFRSTPEEIPAERPTQCGFTRLTHEERLRRLHGGLCMYCGAAGHVVRDCWVRPRRSQAPPPRKRVESVPHADVVQVL